MDRVKAHRPEETSRHHGLAASGDARCTLRVSSSGGSALHRIQVEAERGNIRVQTGEHAERAVMVGLELSPVDGETARIVKID